MLADENSQHLDNSVQTGAAKTVFKASNILELKLTVHNQLINSSDVGINTPMPINARRRCPSKISPKVSAPKEQRKPPKLQSS